MAKWFDVYEQAEYEVKLKARLFSYILWMMIGVFTGFCGLGGHPHPPVRERERISKAREKRQIVRNRSTGTWKH